MINSTTPPKPEKNMNSRQRNMVGHGAIVMIIGLAAGFGLVMSLIGGFEFFPGSILNFELAGESGAWARAHAGGIMNALMIFSGAWLIGALAMPEGSAKNIAWMLVGAGYANTVFYYGAILSSNRALTLGDNRFGETNIAGVIGNFPALVFAVITIIAFVIIAKHAFAKPT